MSFWSIFNNKGGADGKSGLELKLKEKFSHFGEEALVRLTAISGLLASIAYNDFVVTEEEKLAIEKSLQTWVKLSGEEAKAICEIAVEHSKELVNLENHFYTRTLNELMTKDEKYHLVESLFYIAASDGDTSIDESEQIKNIVASLQLPREFYTAARAKVLESINLLK